MTPLQVSLDITPRTRLALTDVRRRAVEIHGDALDGYSHCFYSSLHTTAGYLPQSLQRRLVGRRRGVASYLDLYRALFPERGGYRHDELEARTELTSEQRLREPLNGDSHLQFILGRLRACVSYPVRPDPVYFVDLDGTCDGRPRRRTTVLVGYDSEQEVARTELQVPVSPHPINAVNLKDSRHGLFDRLQDFVERQAAGKGRLRLELGPGERHACLTVNEFETLLMRHDLTDVLRKPLHFAVENARHVLKDPRGIALKARTYTQGPVLYDLVQALTQLVDVLGLPTSRVENLVSHVLSTPAERLFGVKRSVDLLVTDESASGRPTIVQGTYQSPILIHWHRSPQGTRSVQAVLTRLI